MDALEDVSLRHRKGFAEEFLEDLLFLIKMFDIMEKIKNKKIKYKPKI